MTNSQILCGILRTDEYALALNWVILIMKHIYTHKWKKIAVSFAAFLEHLKYQTKIEKESEKMYAKSLSFKWKWQIVENFLTLWLLSKSSQTMFIFFSQINSRLFSHKLISFWKRYCLMVWAETIEIIFYFTCHYNVNDSQLVTCKICTL